MEKTIRYNLDPEELTKANLALRGFSEKWKKPSIILQLVVEGLALLWWFVLLLSSEVDVWRLIFLFSLALPLPAMLLYQYMYLPRRLRGMFEKQKTLRGEYALTFTDEQFLLEGPYGNARLPWNVFIGWKEVEDYLFLYQNNNFVDFAPKRYMDPETLEFVRRKIGENHIPQQSPTGFRHPPVLFAILVTIAVLFFVVSDAVSDIVK